MTDEHANAMEVDQTEKAARKRSADEALTKAKEPDVLVPVSKDQDDNVKYASLEDAKKTLGRDQNINELAVLIRSKSGSYLTKEETLRRTKVEEGTLADEVAAVRQANFSNKMRELGLDSNIPKEAYKDTPSLMVKNEKGEISAVDPKLLKQTNMDELKQANPGYEFYMKGKSGSYINYDTYARQNGDRAAELAYARLSDHAPAAKARGDMGEVYVKLPKGFDGENPRYVEISKYEELAKTDPTLKTETKDREFLLQAANGHGLVTSNGMKRSLSERAVKEIFERNGVKDPENVLSLRDLNKPEVLLRAGNDVLVPGKATNIQPYRSYLPDSDIFMQKPKTGNYIDVETKQIIRAKDPEVRKDRQENVLAELRSAGVVSSKAAEVSRVFGNPNRPLGDVGNTREGLNMTLNPRQLVRGR